MGGLMRRRCFSYVLFCNRFVKYVLNGGSVPSVRKVVVFPLVLRCHGRSLRFTFLRLLRSGGVGLRPR